MHDMKTVESQHPKKNYAKIQKNKIPAKYNLQNYTQQ